ncbi:hypothetical protein Hdeb2414_s0672g00933531 [Helianthus debilis subsp. tardiflorus]
MDRTNILAFRNKPPTPTDAVPNEWFCFTTKQQFSNSKFVWPRDLCYVRYWRRNDKAYHKIRELRNKREEEVC